MVERIYQAVDGANFNTEEKAYAYESVINLTVNLTKIMTCIKELNRLAEASLQSQNIINSVECEKPLQKLANLGMDFMNSVDRVYTHTFVHSEVPDLIHKINRIWKEGMAELEKNHDNGEMK